jgi:hypothetical protein
MFIDVPTRWLILLVLYMDRRAIHTQYSVYAACTARLSIRTKRVNTFTATRFSGNCS